MDLPQFIILFSGKRKCGKDYISEKLKEKLTEEKCSILRISEPIKRHYAEVNKLDLKELMSDGSYKENHRLEMIKWSEEVRSEKPGYFCESTCKRTSCKQIWIVSDIRRKTDIDWFRNTYNDKIKTIRINAEPNIRIQRGFVFTSGVDDVASECDLDDYEGWDLIINNNSTDNIEHVLENILNYFNLYL